VWDNRRRLSSRALPCTGFGFALTLLSGSKGVKKLFDIKLLSHYTPLERSSEIRAQADQTHENLAFGRTCRRVVYAEFHRVECAFRALRSVLEGGSSPKNRAVPETPDDDGLATSEDSRDIKVTRQFHSVCVVSLLLGFALSWAGFGSDLGRASVTLPLLGAARGVVSPALSEAICSPQDPQQDSIARDACLKCHGAFDKLVERTAKFVAPSGETTSPHKYVPHDSKEASALPRCENCHQAHPVPPTVSDLAALPKPNVEWCYSKCHHTKDFTPCKTCHP
jgi:hypothetical protein